MAAEPICCVVVVRRWQRDSENRQGGGAGALLWNVCDKVVMVGVGVAQLLRLPLPASPSGLMSALNVQGRSLRERHGVGNAHGLH